MAEVTAKLKYLRVSPKKVRLLARVIKGLGLREAEATLTHYHKQASRPILKLLRSAAANAEHNFRLAKSELYVEGIMVDPGPSLKRIMPRAMGRATPIWKRTSHITLVLGSRPSKEKIAAREEPKEGIFRQVQEERKPEEIRERKEKEYKPARPAGGRPPEEVKKVAKPKGPGVIRRIFRRKAV
ncbi:MAG: 50S ribosomal protein L22 [Parcubacteria group bacterium]|nr:50S ribosomal protein L22 [Parcubacteria group bacterium]